MLIRLLWGYLCKDKADVVFAERVRVGPPVAWDLVMTRFAACATVPTEMGGCVVWRESYHYVGTLEELTGDS